MKDNGQLTQTVSLRERERAPSPDSSVYAVEDRSPYVGLDIIAVIFVQTFSWTAIMAHYFEGNPCLPASVNENLLFTPQLLYDIDVCRLCILVYVTMTSSLRESDAKFSLVTSQFVPVTSQSCDCDVFIFNVKQQIYSSIWLIVHKSSPMRQGDITVMRL